MDTPHEWFTALYAAFNRRDADAVLAAVAPDVDWPNGFEGGRVHGHAAVRAYWLRQWAAVDPRVEVQRVTVDADGRRVVDVHQVVRDLSGNVLADQTVQHVYETRDGLVQRMDIRGA